MEQIKYRAWDKEIEKMFYFGTIYEMLQGQLEVSDDHWLLHTAHELMGYTGHKDKDGKEIYKGDVISYRKEAPFVVENMLEVKTYLGYKDSEMESWGNIYENPELIVNKEEIAE